jgi:hypothetical protein
VTRIGTWLVAAALVVAGCKGDKSDKTDDDGKKGDPKKESTASTSEAAKPAPSGVAPAVGNAQPGAAGPVYLAVKGSGVVMLDGGAVKMVQPIQYMVKGLTAASDGSVWVAAIDGVYRIERDKSTEVNSDGVDAVAPVSAKDAWALSYDGVSHYDGSSWAKEDKAALGAGDALLRDIAVADDGAVWVVASSSVHRKKKGGAWEKVDLSKATGPGDPFFERVVRGPAGSVYLSYMKGLLVKTGEEWQPLQGDFGFGAPRDISVATQGRVGAVSGMDDGFIVEAAGTKKLSAASTGIKAKRFESLALDDAGRIWLATDNGLAVIDASGKLARQWEPGTLPGLEGAVTRLVVLGAGPTDLPAVGAAETGTVVGKVTKDGSPITSAKVEICASPSMIITTTPCGEAPFKKDTQTDATGKFTLTEVPIGSYGFAIQAGGQWVITIGSECCTKMKKGQEYDVGTIKLDK